MPFHIFLTFPLLYLNTQLFVSIGLRANEQKPWVSWRRSVITDNWSSFSLHMFILSIFVKHTSAYAYMRDKYPAGTMSSFSLSFCPFLSPSFFFFFFFSLLIATQYSRASRTYYTILNNGFFPPFYIEDPLRNFLYTQFIAFFCKYYYYWTIEEEEEGKNDRWNNYI